MTVSSNQISVCGGHETRNTWKTGNIFFSSFRSCQAIDYATHFYLKYIIIAYMTKCVTFIIQKWANVMATAEKATESKFDSPMLRGFQSCHTGHKLCVYRYSHGNFIACSRNDISQNWHFHGNGLHISANTIYYNLLSRRNDMRWQQYEMSQN